jgi:hypothetical protein
MARKIVNRKELREQADAAAAAPDGGGKKAAADKPKKKAKSKVKGEVRLKAFWGVFNQSLKRVALYEYADRKQADKKAQELSASGKSPHFVKPVKEEITVVAE